MSRARLPTDPVQRQLCQADADWLPALRRIGPSQLQPDNGHSPYEALSRAVIYQQLHGRAAAAITARLLALYPRKRYPQPEALLGTSVDTLRACGLSAGKITTLRGIAEGKLAGVVPTRSQAKKLDDEALVAQLTTLRGVGRWTVEMLLMHTLARPDVMPAGDFGVREGWRLLKGLPVQPTPRELLAVSEAWRPHRSTAAWYLWRVVDVSRAGEPP